MDYKMNTDWQIKNYDESSKIWIYTLSKKLDDSLLIEIENELQHFCSQWTAHNKELRAFFKIINQQILLLGVDEHLNPASGCSIDKSVHFLEDLEKKYAVDFFNRLLFTYIDENGNFITEPKHTFEKLIEEHKIQPNTLVVNTLSHNLREWNEFGITAMKNTWLKNYFNIAV
jgi:hypothetical protein